MQTNPSFSTQVWPDAQLEQLATPDSWLVFGGPYSNLQATQALYDLANGLGIQSDRVLCTGDVVAYCADPVATVDLIRQWGCHVVMGNCEESLAAGADDCGCGFDEGTACSLLSDQWYRFSLSRVTEAQRLWMGSLPRSLLISVGGVSCLAIHGSVSTINEFVFESSTDAFFIDQFEQAKAPVIIGGHSGLPFTKLVKGKCWFNAGVIGMPADDGQSSVWFGLITPTEQGLVFSHHRLSYNYQGAAQRMAAVGLNNGYAGALLDGWWPSLDVLPPADLKLAKQRRASVTN